jgi:hypothetical protein
MAGPGTNMLRSHLRSTGVPEGGRCNASYRKQRDVVGDYGPMGELGLICLNFLGSFF